MAPYISTWGSVASVAIEVTEFYASLRCAGWPLAGPPFVAADAYRAAAQCVADEVPNGKVGVERHVWADKRKAAGNDQGCFGSPEGEMEA